MPPSDRATETRARWGLAFGLGVLAEVATIAVIVVAFTVATRSHGDATPEARAALGQRVGAAIGPVAGTLFTALAAWWVARRPLLPRPVLHGLVVALGAIVLHVAGALTEGHGLSRLAILADGAKLVAALGAASLAGRGRR